MSGDKRFLGSGWGFPPSFEPFGGGLALRLVSEEEDIRESLHILLSTAPGERVMQPEYGCSLRRMVFDRLDMSTITALKDVVATAVERHEARIALHEIDVDASEWADGTLRLCLGYTVRMTNAIGNLVYPFHVFQTNGSPQ